MKTLVRNVTTFAVALMGAIALQAQEWSPAQKEVWSNVEARWQAGVNKDLEAYMACIDDDFLGWNRSNQHPHTKAHWRKHAAYSFERPTQTVVWHLEPAGIKIHGDVAIVHYYFSTVVRAKDGTDTWRRGRWTDILQKKGQRWILIGEHGGADLTD
jgi:ketosteroid isomerase-like protein